MNMQAYEVEFLTKASLIVWKDFPESSWADMNWLSHQRGLFRVVSLPNTVVELPSHRNVLLHTICRVAAQRVDWASLDEALAHVVQAGPGDHLINEAAPRINDKIFGTHS